MNFKVFQDYMKVCNIMMFNPSWKGLEEFRIFSLRYLEGLEVRN